MGNQVAALAPAQQDYYLHDLPNLIYQQTLGGGKLLKSIHSVHDEGAVVVKVYFKRSANENLARYEERISELRDRFCLTQHPNIYNNFYFFETEKAAYVFRQYFSCSLYDRVSTRPFLTTIEKKWIAFQILCGLQQSHEAGVCHGDVKCENIMVTSCIWVFITDYAFYKPTYLPADNPADFSFFFDTGGRRRCYLAPERFYPSSSGEAPKGGLTPQMDIFSAGCVIAELFLEGQPIFDLSQLLSYCKGEYDPEEKLAHIEDVGVRKMIMHMLQKDPERRLTAEEYLSQWPEAVFPEYFYTFMYNFMANSMRMDSDSKVNITAERFNSILDHIGLESESTSEKPQISEKSENDPSSGDGEPSGDKGSQEGQGKGHAGPAPRIPQAPYSAADTKEVLADTQAFAKSLDNEDELRQRIDAIMGDSKKGKDDGDDYHTEDVVGFDVNMFFNNTYESDKASLKKMLAPMTSAAAQRRRSSVMQASAPSADKMAAERPLSSHDNGLLIVISLLCSSIRNVMVPVSKLTCLELLLKCGYYVDDDVVMQRLVPYMVTLLLDPSAMVRASALGNLTKLIQMVTVFPPGDANIFPEYILPALSSLSSDPEEMVRLAYAENLASLAETARRFLDISHYMRQRTVLEAASTGTPDPVPYQGSYDLDLGSLQDHFEKVVVEFLTSTSSIVKRMLMSDITRLCMFFGRVRTNDFLLPLLITLLNDRDSELRAAFFQNVVGISAYVGRVSLQAFILPCILQGTIDTEEYVIERALNALTSLCEIGLFDKQSLVDTASKVSPMLVHPSTWIRFGSVAFFTAASRQLPWTDTYCYLWPLMEPYMEREVILANDQTILDALKPPIGRYAFDVAVRTGDVSGISSEASEQLERGITLGAEGSQRAAKLQSDAKMLLEMKSYIVSASEARKTKGMVWGSDESQTSGKKRTKELQGFAELSSRIPIYSIGGGVSLEDSRGRSSPVPIKKSPKGRKTVTEAGEDWPNPMFPAKGEPKKLSRQESRGAGSVNAGPEPTKTSNSSGKLSGFRPKGIRIAHLSDHRAQVNRVRTSENSLYMASASNDGTVKIWDCRRFDKDMTNCCRLTYSSQGGKILDLALCDDCDSVAAASSNGTVHVFKVEYVLRGDGAVDRYSGLSTVKNIDESEGAVMAVEHLPMQSQSLVVYATQKGIIHAWDLRARREAWTMKMQSRFGLVTSMAVDPTKYCLVVGTQGGVVSCWDTRFQIQLQSWRHPSRTPIHSIAPSLTGASSAGGGFCMVASGNNEFVTWDMQYAYPRQIFSVGGGQKGPVNPSEYVGVPLPNLTDSSRMTAQGSLPQVLSLLPLPNSNAVFSAGTDEKIRFWDTLNASRSYVVTGHDPSKPTPEYSTANEYYGDHQGGEFPVSVFEETPVVDPSGDTANASSPSKAGAATSTASSSSGTDVFTGLAVTEIPQPMLVASSRQGVIRVYV